MSANRSSSLLPVLSWRSLRSRLVALACGCLFGLPSIAHGQSESWVDQVIWRERTDGTRSLVVERVLPGSEIPWDLKRGDRVVSYAGTIPESIDELRLLSEQLGSDAAPLAVLRDSRMLTLGGPIDGARPLSSGGTGVPLEELPPAAGADMPAAGGRSILDGVRSRGSEGIGTAESERPVRFGSASEAYGFRVSDFRAERFPGYDTPVLSGALVEEVLGGSPADRAGLRAGMIVVAVDGRRIDSAAEVERWMVERAQETEIAVLAYQGRKLTRVRISTVVSTEEPIGDGEGLSLIDPSGSDDRSADESESRPLIDLGGALEALAGRASDAERFESESDREPLMLADPAENLGEVPLEELPAVDQERSNGSPANDSGESTDAGDSTGAGQAGSENREEPSSRRGVLGGLLRRGGEGSERDGRNRPMSTAARNASIEALERRIERQLELLERQQRELAEMQAELARLKTER